MYYILAIFIIIDLPEAPGTPSVDEVTATTCHVSWTAPTEDGGSPIIGYFVERQSNVSPRWIRINRAVVSDTTLLVDDLVEGTEYIFRAIAVNKKGESKPSKPSENVLAKSPFGRLWFIVFCMLHVDTKYLSIIMHAFEVCLYSNAIILFCRSSKHGKSQHHGHYTINIWTSSHQLQLSDHLTTTPFPPLFHPLSLVK